MGEKEAVWLVGPQGTETNIPFCLGWDSCNVIDVDHDMGPLAQEERGPKLMKRNQIS